MNKLEFLADKFKLNSFLTRFILIIGAQVVLVFLFPEKIYKLMASVEIQPKLMNYELFLTPILLLLCGWLFIKNLSHLKDLVKNDKFFKIALLAIFLIFVFLLFKDINIIRIDKGLSAIRAIDSSSAVDLGGSLFAQRASGFFFIMHFIGKLIMINFEVLAFVSTFLLLLQFIAFYFILKLILEDNRIVFVASLIFFLHPNNFLIARAPDYFFAGQVLGTLSLLALLLFVKYRDNKNLFLSLALLVLAMLFRIEMVIWFFVYFIMLFFLIKEEDFFKIKKYIYLFLLLIFPVTIRIIVSFISSPFILNSYVDPAESSAIIGTASYVGGLVAFYNKTIPGHLFKNLEYLFTAIPLSAAFLISLFFYKNKNIKIYLFYFFTYFAAITIFQYNELINAPQYLSHLILPLVVLTGIIFDLLILKRKIFIIFVYLTALLIILLNIYFFRPGYVWTDENTVIENNVYKLIKQSKGKIPDGSLVITNSSNNVHQGFYGLNNKKVKIITADIDLVEQINSNKDRYHNIFLSQGPFDCSQVYGSFSTFGRVAFPQLIKSNFAYEVIYEKTKKELLDSRFPISLTGFRENCLIFFYKVTF